MFLGGHLVLRYGDNEYFITLADEKLKRIISDSSLRGKLNKFSENQILNQYIEKEGFAIQKKKHIYNFFTTLNFSLQLP